VAAKRIADPPQAASPVKPSAPPDVAKLERDLVTVARRKARTEAADADAERERDRVIRDAIEAKIPRARIGDLVGLSVQRIDQIRRGARL
jgi:hypothetical protein